MLVRGVVDDQIDDHPHAAVLGRADDLDEVAVGTQPGIHAVEVGDVIAVVPFRRRVERHQPQARDAEAGQVVQALGQTLQVPAAVAVPIHEGLDVQAIDDGGLPPQIAGVGDPHRATRAVTSSWGSTFVPKTSMNSSCSCPTWCR